MASVWREETEIREWEEAERPEAGRGGASSAYINNFSLFDQQETYRRFNCDPAM